MAEICVCKHTYEKFGPSWFNSMPPCESGGFCWVFSPKMVLPELCNDGFWLLNESLSRAWMAHSKFIYYKGNMSNNLFRCELFCNKWHIQISRIQKQAYSICTHNLCCRPLLLYFYEPFVSSFPSFLPPFSSLPSFSPSLRFPNDFLAFHFFPCPNPATEARMQLKSLFCLNRIVFTLDPLLHHLGPVDAFRCLISSHEATPSPLNTSIASSNTLFPQTDPLPSLMCLIHDSLFTFVFISLLEQQHKKKPISCLICFICVWLNLK